MDQQTVLVFHCTSLLGLGVESILSGYEDIHPVVIYNYPKDENELFELLDLHHPQVIIWVGCKDYLPNSMLLMLLKRAPDIRVISVSLEHNWLQIYQKQDVLMTRPSDLLQAIYPC